MAATTLNLANYTTVFAENFANDTAVDRSLWGAQWGTAGYSFAGDALTLTSYASTGWAATGFLQQPTGAAAGEGYGLYSVTAQLDANQGVGVAIQLWPANNVWPGGEIDLVETWDTTRQSAYSTIHWRGADGSDQYQSFIWNADLTKVHTYALDWQPAEVSFYIDGKLTWSTTSHIPADAAHGGVNAVFGAQVTGAQYLAQPQSQVALHLYDMSFSTLKPGAVVAPAPAAPTPASLTLGSGADALVLKISQDEWNGAAQYTVSVDGRQIGGIQSATAWHSAGQDDTVTVRGDFGAGNHTVSVNFLNDGYGGSPATDRNLYVDGMSFNGTAIGGGSAALLGTGAKNFSFTAAGSTAPAATPVTATIGTGADTLLLKISQDAWQGNAQYTVSIDGKQVGGTLSAAALHANGQDDLISVKGDFGTATHKVTVNFLNDAWGGSAGTDRNLYVDAISLNGKAVAGGSTALMSSGPRDFSFTGTAATPPAPTSPAPVSPATADIGSGADTLLLKISQDAWNGSAQYTVSVDGKQVGGTLTAAALHANGQDDLVAVHGNWAAGPHSVKVSFLNDAWGGTAATDRNLYVDGISLNGTAIANSTAALMSAGGKDFAFTGTGVVVDSSVSVLRSIGHGADALAIRLSQDAWQGDAQFTVSVDGRQIGGTFSASALHSGSGDDVLTVLGNFGSGAHTLKLAFLNDAYGGTAATDRNLFVDGVSYKGALVSNGAALLSAGTSSFGFSGGSAAGSADAVVQMNGHAGADAFTFAAGDAHAVVTGFQAGQDVLRFLPGISAADVHTAAATEGGASGLLVTYDSTGHSVFLAGITQLSAADMVFG